MTREDIRDYHDIVTEAWKMFRLYADRVPLNDDEWQEVVNLTDDIVKRHTGHDRYARKAVMVVVDELEHLDRGEP